MLLAVFGFSWAVTIPLIFAACTISGTLGIVYGVASIWATPTYATNLVQLIGLGIAVDYSLLIVYRFREELATGKDIDDAVVRTMQTAGRAVVFSGIAVALGLALLVAMPLPFIRMLGVAGFLIPIVSIVGAVTLQPVLLSFYGRRGTARHRVLPRRDTPTDAGFWARLARTIMARPILFLVAGTSVLVADGRAGVLDPAHPGLDLRHPANVAVGERVRRASAGGRGGRRRAVAGPRRGPAGGGERARDAGCGEAARRRARARPRGRQGLHRHRQRRSSTRPGRSGRCSSPAATTTASRSPRRS